MLLNKDAEGRSLSPFSINYPTSSVAHRLSLSRALTDSPGARPSQTLLILWNSYAVLLYRTGSPAHCSVVIYGVGGGRENGREAQEGEDICIHTADSLHCTAKANIFKQLCVCAVLSHSVVSDFSTPWTVACQAPPSMGFPRQEYRSGLKQLYSDKKFFLISMVS